MKIPLNKIVFMMAFGLAICFAQDAPLAVYTSGSKDVGINKSLSNKLLATMVQSGIYVEIGDPGSFQDEIVRSGKNDLTSIIQTAKRYGADYVCAVSITEVFGTHSISARLIKIASSQVVKTGVVDRSLKSLGDLSTVSNELAKQLLPYSVAPVTSPAVAVPHSMPPQAYSPPPQQNAMPPQTYSLPPQQNAMPLQPVAPYSPPPSPFAPPMAVQGQCARMYNINELLSKIRDGFPTQLKDCSSKLAKDMLTPASFGGKTLEPKSFMIQCPIDGIKKELPEGFPDVNRVINSLTNFVQGIMNTAMAGAALDPKKLISAVSSMNVNELLNEIKSLSNNECVVDEPYAPPVAQHMENFEESSSSRESGRSVVSFGIRAGINTSYTYAEFDEFDSQGQYKSSGEGDYNDIIGIQLGFVLDIAISRVFHLQPGFMYVQKGRDTIPAHYLEFPMLFSLKFSAFRVNAGPYIGICMDSDDWIYDDGLDAGFSMGVGFDIDRFYIGAFYDYGFADMSSKDNYSFFNRTLGFNVGMNF